MKVRCIESIQLNGPNGYLLKYTLIKPFKPYRQNYTYIFPNESFCVNKYYPYFKKIMH